MMAVGRKELGSICVLPSSSAPSVCLSCAPRAHLSCRHGPRGMQDCPLGDGAPGAIQG